MTNPTGGGQSASLINKAPESYMWSINLVWAASVAGLLLFTACDSGSDSTGSPQADSADAGSDSTESPMTISEACTARVQVLCSKLFECFTTEEIGPEMPNQGVCVSLTEAANGCEGLTMCSNGAAFYPEDAARCVDDIAGMNCAAFKVASEDDVQPQACDDSCR